MGITTAILRVREHRKSAKFSDVEFLVDSGAVYSVVPGKILDDLENDPYHEMSFALADGTAIKRRISSAYFELEGEGRPAPVVYGEEGDTALLGATTLEVYWSRIKSIYTYTTPHEITDGITNIEIKINKYYK